MKPASIAVAPTEEAKRAAAESASEALSMLTPERIAGLEAFDGGGERVLSVYLDLDPQRQARHAYRLVLKNLAKEVRSRLDRKACAGFQANFTRVQEWLDGRAPHGKGVALGRVFRILDPKVKNPQSEQWERAIRLFDELL